MESPVYTCETDCPQLDYFAKLVGEYTLLREDIHKEGGYAQQVMEAMESFDEQIMQCQEHPKQVKELTEKRTFAHENLTRVIGNCEAIIKLTPDVVRNVNIPKCQGKPEVQESPNGITLFCQSTALAPEMREKTSKTIGTNA